MTCFKCRIKRGVVLLVWTQSPPHTLAEFRTDVVCLGFKAS